jgi:ligand-binding sensor domain-containing protein
MLVYSGDCALPSRLSKHRSQAIVKIVARVRRLPALSLCAKDGRLASVVIAALVALAGPASALSPHRLLTQYMHDVWTPRTGAPFGSIHALTQTPDGYLWIGTASEGLYRFDGARFVRDNDLDHVFDRDENIVWAVVADAKGDLWAATPYGVARRQQGRWKVVVAGIYATDIALMDDGELLVASPPGGLIRWRNGHTETIRIPGHCVRVCPGRDGEVWVGGPDGGLSRIRGNKVVTLTERSGMSSNNVADLHLDRSGDLWVATRGGLNRLQRGRVVKSITRRDGLPSDDVTAIFEDKNGTLWIGTGTDGLARLWQGHIESFGKTQGLPDNSVAAFYEDQEGSLWIATKGGLSRFKEGRFTPFGVPEGLGHDKVISIIEGRDGSIWIWSDGGGLSRIKDGRVRVYNTRDGLASNFGGPLFEDRDGGIWIGHDRGASRIKDGHVTTYVEGPIGKAYVPFFAEDKDGLLTYVFRMGLVHLREDRVTPLRLRSYEPGYRSSPDKLPMPFMARRMRDGTLWLGTNNGAWTLRDGELKRVWSVPGRLPTVVWIHEDDEGAVWLATWEGLYQGRSSRSDHHAPGIAPQQNLSSARRSTGLLLDELAARDLSSPQAGIGGSRRWTPPACRIRALRRRRRHAIAAIARRGAALRLRRERRPTLVRDLGGSGGRESDGVAAQHAHADCGCRRRRG